MFVYILLSTCQWVHMVFSLWMNLVFSYSSQLVCSGMGLKSFVRWWIEIYQGWENIFTCESFQRFWTSPLCLSCVYGGHIRRSMRSSFCRHLFLSLQSTLDDGVQQTEKVALNNCFYTLTNMLWWWENGPHILTCLVGAIDLYSWNFMQVQYLNPHLKLNWKCVITLINPTLLQLCVSDLNNQNVHTYVPHRHPLNWFNRHTACMVYPMYIRIH